MRVLLTIGLLFATGCTCSQVDSKKPGIHAQKKGKFKGKRKGKRKNGANFERVDATLWFVDQKKFDAGEEDFWVSATRPVGAKTPAKNAVWQLFKGPTPEEAAEGMVLHKSGAEGFQSFKVEGKTATLQLRAGCTNEGGTVTIFDHLAKTLKSFPEIEHVKVLSPDGATQNAEGEGDSKPACLEP